MKRRSARPRHAAKRVKRPGSTGHGTVRGGKEEAEEEESCESSSDAGSDSETVQDLLLSQLKAKSNSDLQAYLEHLNDQRDPVMLDLLEGLFVDCFQAHETDYHRVSRLVAASSGWREALTKLAVLWRARTPLVPLPYLLVKSMLSAGLSTDEFAPDVDSESE